MKKPCIHKSLAILGTISLFILIMTGCGEDKKPVSGNKIANSPSPICNRVERHDHSDTEWRDTQTGTIYHRDGNYLREENNTTNRVYCPSLGGKNNDRDRNNACKNTYYANGHFYNYDTGEVVGNCNLKDYVSVANGNTCPYGYTPYQDMGYDAWGRPFYRTFCLNTYMFYNWGSGYRWQYNYNYWNNNEGTLPFWLTTGLLVGLLL